MADIVICKEPRCGFKIVTDDAGGTMEAHIAQKHGKKGVPFHVEPHRRGMPAMTSKEAQDRGHVVHDEHLALDEDEARREDRDRDAQGKD